MKAHPRTLDHSPEKLRELADACVFASHDECGDFDLLQSAAAALGDWADIREGVELVGVDGTSYPLPIKEGNSDA